MTSSNYQNWQQLVFDTEDTRAYSSSYRDKTTNAWMVARSNVGIEVPKMGFEYYSINAVSGSRSDENVTKYRSILVESDTLSLKDQYEILNKKSFPFSMATLSGGKSIHFLIILETPLRTRAEYDRLVKRVYLAIPGADKSCKNPSRLSRTPSAIRKSNAGYQELLFLGQRIPNSELENFLFSNGITDDNFDDQPRSKIEWTSNISDIDKLAFLNPATQNFLNYGAKEGGRNNRLFIASCDAATIGFAIDEWIEIVVTCDAVHGLPEKEIYSAVSSAFNRVNK